MTEVSRLSSKKAKSPQDQPSISATKLIVMMALDTTWRAFIPTLGGVFVGIGIDHVLGAAPNGMIICLLTGISLSIILIVKQLRDMRKRVS